MPFQIMAYITAAAACLLGLRFIFAGGGVLKEWGIEGTAGALILFRRLGVIYLGLALIFFLGRNAAPSDFRSAVCLVMAGAVAVLASLGLFEFLSRRASSGIFRSVVSEAVLSAAFVWLWWSGR
ncbi:hypothetical protein [Methyloceanibacter caenitepidi]|uniref:Transmembrane protein n=1 Tax=Methyloceanibacter caenitepidi TaxID=1384459 RepID=A0A0A8K653_9HYPH|nr:hypothetical protein [Methyloceanibacter caenitepidi]BAQ18276.1 hypothetical protein GL4_2843 [Methyloceanibacter caenitepidi]